MGSLSYGVSDRAFFEAMRTSGRITYLLWFADRFRTSDKGFRSLCVSAESGIIAILDESGRNLEKIAEGFFAANMTSFETRHIHYRRSRTHSLAIHLLVFSFLLED